MQWEASERCRDKRQTGSIRIRINKINNTDVSLKFHFSQWWFRIEQIICFPSNFWFQLRYSDSNASVCHASHHPNDRLASGHDASACHASHHPNDHLASGRLASGRHAGGHHATGRHAGGRHAGGRHHHHKTGPTEYVEWYSMSTIGLTTRPGVAARPVVAAGPSMWRCCQTTLWVAAVLGETTACQAKLTACQTLGGHVACQASCQTLGGHVACQASCQTLGGHVAWQAFCQALEAHKVTCQTMGLAASGLSDVLSARTESQTFRGRYSSESCWGYPIDLEHPPSLRLRLDYRLNIRIAIIIQKLPAEQVYHETTYLTFSWQNFWSATKLSQSTKQPGHQLQHHKEALCPVSRQGWYCLGLTVNSKQPSLITVGIRLWIYWWQREYIRQRFYAKSQSMQRRRHPIRSDTLPGQDCLSRAQFWPQLFLQVSNLNQSAIETSQESQKPDNYTAILNFTISL